MTTQNFPLAPRVLIADDHPLYCDALRAVVPQAYPGADISEANSQEQVLSTVAAGSETGAREPPLTAIRLSAFRAAPSAFHCLCLTLIATVSVFVPA